MVMEAPMIIGIDPRVDIVFKKLFGSPKHPRLTLSLVNAILETAGLPKAVTLTVQNPFVFGDFKGDKTCELDILYRDQDGKDVQLEMQIESHTGLNQRMLHNWSRLYGSQLVTGQEYMEHRPVISIWILNEKTFDDGQWFHLFRFNCPLSGTVLHDDACVITIELPVWHRLMERQNRGILDAVGRWNYFLTTAHGLEVSELTAKLDDPVFKEAVTIMADFEKIRRLRHAYDMRENGPRIIAAYKRTGFEAGLEEGRVVGMAQGLADGMAVGKAEAAREIARELKVSGMAVEQMSAITGISIEDLNSI